VTFPDERQYFPPPEKWTENEYAQFEEPMHQRRQSNANQNSSARQSFAPNLSNDRTLEVARTTSCQLVGKKFTLEEGTRVKVLESLPHLKCFKVAYNRQSGVFPMRDFKQPDHSA
jgi:hypothetical protein